ncbi:hypothetical protein N9383_05450, partial [Granulosicoccus sp.]|nr:hypothetical protein [Granulosicoccus sp.]
MIIGKEFAAHLDFNTIAFGVGHYLNSTCERLNLSPPKLTRANVRAMMQYSWPGNIRELQNVMERAAILSRNGKLTLDLPKAVDATSRTVHDGTRIEAGSDGGTVPDRILTHAELAALEKDNLKRALAATGGRVSGRNGAAVLLGMRPTTVYSRIKSLHLSN